jgi:predicted Zn-dependent peptidase
MDNVKKHVFSNQFTLTHIFTKCNVYRIELIVKAGMLQEKPKQLGFAHLIEHVMSFFPSSKYPDSTLNQQEMNRISKETNAWTSENSCGYYIEGDMKYFLNILDLIFENYVDPQLDATIFEQEKEAVIKELEDITLNKWYSFEHFVQAFEYAGTILQCSVHDEIKNIKQNANLNNILEFRKKFYRPEITHVQLNVQILIVWVFLVACRLLRLIQFDIHYTW